LDAVKPGDQMLARGAKSADGNTVTADAVISGAFRNLSGTITSITPSENILVLKDATTKQTFTVKVTADSQIRKLTPQAANMLAARMKAASGGGAAGQGGPSGAAVPAAPQGAADNGGGRGAGRGRGGFGGGGGDLSQVVARAPTATLADMQKGDALMIVATSGSTANEVAAIQVVAGVEPILVASPSASMNLPAWDVGGGGDQ
jgi:hypothetical protein